VKKIPDSLPTVLIDRSILAWQELGLAEFMLQMEMEFTSGPDEELLRRALDLLLDAQPVLGCRLVKRPYRPVWLRLSDKERRNIFKTGDEQAYERFKSETIDSKSGPQVKAFLHRGTDRDRLLLKVSHVVADAGGVKEIAADFASIYSNLEQDPDYEPVPNLKGDRGTMQLFHQFPIEKTPTIVSDFLAVTWINSVPAPTLTLPLPEGNYAGRPFVYVKRCFDNERTAMLSAYGRARRASLNDMILAASFRALVAAADWDGRASLSLQMTFDYRRWYLPTDRAGGICNLSAFEFPTPGRTIGRDFDDTLTRVSSYMRRRKERFPGLAIACISPLLFALPYAGLRTFFGTLTGCQIAANNYPNTFTNMGPIKKDELQFGDITPIRAWLLPPPIHPPVFAFGMSGYDGSLTISAGVPDSLESIADDFLENIIRELPCQ